MGCVHRGGGVHHLIAYLFYLWFGPILTHFFKITELYLVALARTCMPYLYLIKVAIIFLMVEPSTQL